ncbi:hypothetical protein ETAA8_32320 [Anatilimnocola aggregata]|uniref:Uncharacterized protein n=1 Tax=Anatilimnocola aggregata TaxID=2528021 RepID=A0A517YDC5_9BACT|nr:hypothetical protein [Anatilimnocola aggregata]QDU28132.1 hypothetical protein ETAA8_32320 [Anatilimnocola aggregata]
MSLLRFVAIFSGDECLTPVTSHIYQPLMPSAFASAAWRSVLLLLVASATNGVAFSAEPSRVLSVLRDFDRDQPGPLQPLKHHTWNATTQANAANYSQVEIVLLAAEEQACKLTIGADFPWGNRDEYRALTIGPDYLPPAADALRLRVKVLRGKFTLAVGSPTVYFGHSDVATTTREVSKADGDEWQTIEFSLHHNLRRNFRRARFGEKSPVIYYTRWIQEPLYLYVDKPSAGELLIDQIELLTKGEGQPFPTFTPDQVRPVATIVDFEKETDLQQAFTFFQDPIDFTKPAYAVRPDWLPPKLDRLAVGHTGLHSLRSQQRGTEETCFTGIHAPGNKEANALQLTLKLDHDRLESEVALDFLVYVTLPGNSARFPWQRFQPPELWRSSPLAFTYYLGQQQTKGESYAFYHTRRSLPKGAWTSLVLPGDDFICAYGQGDCANLFQSQSPLKCDGIQAIGFVAPYRQRYGTTTVTIDELSWVQVPSTALPRHTYWQAPPPK